MFYSNSFYFKITFELQLIDFFEYKLFVYRFLFLYRYIGTNIGFYFLSSVKAESFFKFNFIALKYRY